MGTLTTLISTATPPTRREPNGGRSAFDVSSARGERLGLVPNKLLAPRSQQPIASVLSDNDEWTTCFQRTPFRLARAMLFQCAFGPYVTSYGRLRHASYQRNPREAPTVLD